MENNDFYDSITDGIANAIAELFPDLDCCGQDGYELLIEVFGENMTEKRMKAYTDEDCEKFSIVMKSLFEMPGNVSHEQVRNILNRALDQWGG